MLNNRFTARALEDVTFTLLRSLFEARYLLWLLKRFGVIRTVILSCIMGFGVATVVMVPINYATGGSIVTGLIVTFVISTTLLPLYVYQIGHLLLQLHTAQEVLYQLTITDELTSTYNRRYALNQLSQIEGDPQILSYSLLLLDIDYFKRINDTYGHTVGDLVLVAFARACQALMREGDLLARYGGEEFLCILPHTGQLEALNVAERLRSQITQMPIPIPEHDPITITMSIGISTCIKASANTGELLNQADQALYLAKQHGRNQVWLAPAPMRETTIPMT